MNFLHQNIMEKSSRKILSLMVLTGLITGSIAQEIILKKDWNVQAGEQQGIANLPGTLGDVKIGEKAKESVYGALTPKYQFVGKAVYTQTINVTKEMIGKDYELFLERVLWKSTVYFDKQKLGDFDSFATPHKYVIPANLLTVGQHKITIEIDNSRIYKITDKGHAYGDSMQTRWNGVIGKVALQPKADWQQVQIDNSYPAKQVAIDFVTSKPAAQYQVELAFIVKNNSKMIKTATLQPISLGNNKYQLILPIEENVIKPWDEFDPNLYQLTVKNQEKEVFSKKIGFRTFTKVGNRLFINGRPLFLRANLDNCHFPLTGYPAMDKDAWRRIMKISQQNGLNSIRFHSWCPPQAAFDVADELGMYLAPEAGIWIDGWMMGKGFPDVKGLGRGEQDVDNFVQNELDRILMTYGNSPSMMSLCVGNELGNSDFNILNAWMAKCKEKYPNHLYSASTARAITPTDDFLVTHNYPGVGGVRERQMPHTNWDYEGSYSRTKIPTIAHEIGQWPVYPDWNEINKYTGLLRPWNLELLRDESKKKGVYRFNKHFHTSSLKTNRLMYKDEIESFMRTPSCAGIHLLGILDYSGQGEALIGWLDSFYDEKKGLENEPQVLQFFAPVVGLARFAKYTWNVGEIFNATLLIRNQGNKDILQGTEIEASFAGKTWKVKLDETIKVGELKVCQQLSIPLDESLANSKQRLTFAGNQWDIWVYPQYQQMSTPKNVVFTTQFDEVMSALNKGERVLFDASQAGNKKSVFRSSFRPVYWSTTWFPGQANTTLGLWVDAKHPALAKFPTDDWQSWQWYFLVNSGKNFILKDLNEDYTPIVMPIDDFHRNRFGAAIFEVAVGKGKLLVCSYNLSQNRPEAKQLRNSLLHYVASTDFNPKQQVNEKWLNEILADEVVKLQPRPKEYANAVVYFECAAKLRNENRDNPWTKFLDRAELTSGSYEVSGTNFRTWRDSAGSYWVADQLTLVLKNVPQVRGKLLVRFRDPNHNNRTSKGTFEGRSFVIPKHQDNPNGIYWLTIPVDMEDGLDGKLIFEVEKTSGSNVMIDRVIYMPN